MERNGMTESNQPTTPRAGSQDVPAVATVHDDRPSAFVPDKPSASSFDAQLAASMHDVPPATRTAAPAPRHRAAPPGAGTVGRTQDAWAVWLLSIVTLGIYYLVWYYRINRELGLFAPAAVTVSPGLAVLAQLVPIVNLVGLARTAGRLNAAHASVGSAVRVSAGVTVLGAFWYASQTRYLQRRLNRLWETKALPG
jgi:hypothetical protein